MNIWVNQDELAKLLEEIAYFVNEDRYDKLGALFGRVKRLRRKGVSADYNMAAPVLEAFTKAISDYIGDDEYDDARITIDELAEFVETLDLPIGEESATRISDAYVKAISDYIEDDAYNDALETVEDLKEFLEIFGLSIIKENAYSISDAYSSKISRSIQSGQYDNAEGWIEDLGEFIENFSLTDDEKLVSKVIDSYTSLVEAYISVKNFRRADEIKEFIGEYKEGGKPFRWSSTSPQLRVATRQRVKTAGLSCAHCGIETPPGSSFCPSCGEPLN